MIDSLQLALNILLFCFCRTAKFNNSQAGGKFQVPTQETGSYYKVIKLMRLNYAIYLKGSFEALSIARRTGLDKAGQNGIMSSVSVMFFSIVSM